MSYAQGGNFASGFVSAGIGGYLGAQAGDNYAAGFLSAAIVGGATSAMTGGKFANGAESAAFAFVIQAGIQRIGAGGITSDTDSLNLNPNGVTNDVTPSKVLHISKDVGPNGEKILRVDATIANNDLSNTKFAKGVSQIESELGNAQVNEHGTVYKLEVHLTVTDDVAHADVIMSQSRSGSNHTDGFGNSAHEISISKFQDGKTAAHEFGHLLRLHHQDNDTLGLMSYNLGRRGITMSTNHELQRLYNAY